MLSEMLCTFCLSLGLFMVLFQEGVIYQAVCGCCHSTADGATVGVVQDMAKGSDIGCCPGPFHMTAQKHILSFYLASMPVQFSEEATEQSRASPK